MDHQKKIELTSINILELEKQLSCPSGESGVAVSKVMNETNFNMSLDSIKQLELGHDDFILEIGHGNCGHLPKVFELGGNNISYFGIEISETMKLEAEKLNRISRANQRASFYLYDGNRIPFSEDSFDKVMTVNTIYFWKKPIDFLLEIGRVVRPNGIFALTFVEEQSMKSLPFVRERFNLFSKSKLRLLISKTEWKLITFVDQYERVKSKTGEWVDRHFIVAKLSNQKKELES
ncbi:MAG: class I SAM-dependent methyltransferase [Flavobacteriales bacterium]|jgi:SAM-dependent methyltransferase|nr:class I SAM-dependent methyltransferase [Flavobacteriales bacterium]